MGKLNWLVTGAVAGLAAAAIGQELEKEPEQRTWRGKVAGVPYNFRLADWPTIAREYWNPESDELFVPHVIGLGWGVNLAAVLKRAQQMTATQLANEPRRIPEPVER